MLEHGGNIEPIGPDMSGVGIEVLRARCARSDSLERSLSFRRRLAQGRIDILRSERARRLRARFERSEGAALEELAAALAGPHRNQGAARRCAQLEVGQEAAVLAFEVDLVADPGLVSEPARLGRAELEALEQALVSYESSLSRRRKELHREIDRLHAELVRRYREGVADPLGQLRSAATGGPAVRRM